MRSPLAAWLVNEAGEFGAQSLWGRVVAVFGGLAAGLGLRVHLLGGSPLSVSRRATASLCRGVSRSRSPNCDEGAPPGHSADDSIVRPQGPRRMSRAVADQVPLVADLPKTLGR